LKLLSPAHADAWAGAPFLTQQRTIVIINTVQIHQKVQLLFKFSLGLFIASNLAVAFAQTDGVRAEQPTIKVGDVWKSETRDRRTGLRLSGSLRTVTSVSATQIEGTFNAGKFVATPDLNFIETPTYSQTGDVRHLVFPLELGKKWDSKFKYFNKANSWDVRWQFDAKVTAYEKVKVPAGEFDAFKIEYKGYWNNDSLGASGRLVITSWYAPAAKSIVKNEYDDTYNITVTELLEVQLQP
jgi:hypothetical protein